MKVKSVPFALPPGTALADLLPHAEVVGWLHGADGMVGWGRAFAVQLPAAHQFPAAKKAWHDLVAEAEVDDQVHAFGSGLVGFGSFSFDPKSEAGAVLVVPRVLIGRRGDKCWLTTVDTDIKPETILGQHIGAAPSYCDISEDMAGDIPLHLTATMSDISYDILSDNPGYINIDMNEPVRAPVGVTETALDGDDWQTERTVWKAAVAEALERINSGAAEKVVLAREITLSAPAPFSAAWALKRLAHRFHETWNYAIDSFVGATPEMLVSVRDGVVTSLVLAGTIPIPPNSDEAAIDLLAEKLTNSTLDRTKHANAVDQVANALAPFCTELSSSETEILELPNILHLATWITGEYADPQNAITSLYLAGILHPTQAVSGIPTAAALDIIRDLELFDRGRYAGPVGWIGATGDGEWGIALRCAHLVGSRAHLFAGCGIVAGSQPTHELLKSEAKLAPMRWALGAAPDHEEPSEAEPEPTVKPSLKLIKNA